MDVWFRKTASSDVLPMTLPLSVTEKSNNDDYCILINEKPILRSTTKNQNKVLTLAEAWSMKDPVEAEH